MVHSKNQETKKPRVLYSFPHRIGAGRICNTAWHQVNGIANASCSVTLFTGSTARLLPAEVAIHKTLSIGNLRIPIRLIGRSLACRLHDYRVASWLKKHHRNVDLVHCWPLGSLKTLQVAKAQGVPSFMERPNAHTRFAFNIATEENQIVGIDLPPDHDHKMNSETLRREESEYELSDYLLCPSEFVAETFAKEGFPEAKLAKHQYGCDISKFKSQQRGKTEPFRAIYAGVCEPRKGLHYVLEAWVASEASKTGELLICGSFVPDYKEKVSKHLSHPSVKYLGHRKDLPELMGKSDIFLLSSVEEGSALVTYEARASGCVLIVSSSTGAKGTNEENILVHAPRDWETMRNHINKAYTDRAFLDRMKDLSLKEREILSWTHAGKRLADIYKGKLTKNGRNTPS